MAICYCGNRNLCEAKRTVVHEGEKIRVHSDDACGVFPAGKVPWDLVTAEPGRLILEFVVDQRIESVIDVASALRHVESDPDWPFSVIGRADRVAYAPPGGPQKVLKTRSGK